MSNKEFLKYWVVCFTFSIAEDIIKGKELYLSIFSSLIISFLAVQTVRLGFYLYKKYRTR
jgi:hypothetical protein